MTILIRATAVAGLLSLTLLAAACATPPPPPAKFGPDSATGLLVVTSPRSPYLHSADFRRVDLGDGRFEQEAATFNASGRSGTAINSDGEVYLTVSEVKPGDYALVGLFTARGAAQAGACLGDRSPVYAVEAGRITIVRIDPYWREALPTAALPEVSDRAVLALFGTARGALPGVRGDASIIEPSAVLRWDQPGRAWTRNCVQAPTFTRLG